VHGRLAAEDLAHAAWLTRDVGVDACEHRRVRFKDLASHTAPRLAAFRLPKEAAQRGEEGLA
jgi:hypothetical protein